MSSQTQRHACGCDGCDEYTMTPDSYCVKCHHHDCGQEVNCK